MVRLTSRRIITNYREKYARIVRQSWISDVGHGNAVDVYSPGITIAIPAHLSDIALRNYGITRRRWALSGRDRRQNVDRLFGRVSRMKPDLRCDGILPHMTNIESAWLAGLIEGEGYIGHLAKHNVPVIRIVLTKDYDVVQRVHQITGIGRLATRKAQKEGHSSSYYWEITNWFNFVTICNEIFPYLGLRRQAKIREVLAFNPRRRTGRLVGIPPPFKW